MKKGGFGFAAGTELSQNRISDSKEGQRRNLLALFFIEIHSRSQEIYLHGVSPKKRPAFFISERSG